MRKVKLIVVFILFFFFAYSNVLAGVCKDKTLSSSGYCELDVPYVYAGRETSDSYKNRHFAATGIKGHLGYGYEAINGTISRQKEYAFCLDPGKADPRSYSYARELKINKSDFDQDVYKAYQYYVNAVAYDKNQNKYTEESRNKYIAYTDTVLRAYTLSYGYDLEADEYPYYYYNVIPYIIGANEAFLRNRAGDKYFDLVKNNNSNKTCTKKDSTLANHSSCGKSWASKTDIDLVKDYFNSVVTGDFLWNNPLTIVPAVENNSNGDYIFSFTVNFKNDNYSYFGVSTGEKHYDYDVGYGHAFFNFLGFTVNGSDYVYNTDNSEVPKTEVTARDASGNYVSAANQSITYKLTIPKDKFIELNAATGKIDVRLKYKTYHPMSEENVFVNYINSRETVNQSVYQRMIVFTQFVKEDSIGLSSNIEIPGLDCVQEGDVFKINGVEVDMNEYIASCKCEKLDESVLSDSKKEEFNESSCKSKEIITVTSDLKACDVSGELDKSDYQITYKEERKINDYCSLSCTETLNINKLVTYNHNLSVKAGMYFKLPQYPELTGTKTCTVNMTNHTFDGREIKGYNKLIEEYNTLIQDLPELYNNKEYFANAEPLTNSSCVCGSTTLADGTVQLIYCTKYNYSTTYVSSTINSQNEIIPNGSRTYNFSYCSSDGLGDDLDYSLSNYTERVEEIRSLLTSLRTCTNTLKNIGYLNTDFYKFNGDMDFYYEQEYANKDIGMVYNDARPNNVGDNEIIFNSISETGSAKEEYLPKTIPYYFYIDSDGYGNVDFVEDGEKEEYKRFVTYKYTDSRSAINKYVDSYTGTITSERAYLKNPISLGYVYDIDVTAKTKAENKNYYQFSTLGDDNKIYNYFSNGGTVDFSGSERNSTVDDLNRYCSYAITNQVFKDPDPHNTPDDYNSKLNVVYRIVEPNDIDPNGRLGVDGFWNWNNRLGEVTKAKIEQDDTYNPENIEYSFTLDSATIKKIRDDYSDSNYSDFNLDCNPDGLECKSDFVSEYADITDGRSRWKNITTSDDGTIKIDGEKVDIEQ